MTEIGTVGLNRDKLKQDVWSGQFKGYELFAAKKLLNKLPVGHIEWEDLVSEIRILAIEAVDLYDPSRGAAFPTFLTRHLQIRSMQWMNWCWEKKNHPSGKSVVKFSSYEDESAFDLEDVRALPGDLSPAIHELLEALSPSGKGILCMMFERMDDLLLEAFDSEQTQVIISKVASATGLLPEQVDGFLRELHVKLPKYIDAIGVA